MILPRALACRRVPLQLNLQTIRRKLSSTPAPVAAVQSKKNASATGPGTVSSPYRDIKLSELSYYDYVFEHVTSHLHRTAAVDGVSGESWTFSRMKDGATRFGSALKSLQPECNILGIFLPNCIEYPMVFSGAAMVNVPTTTMNPVYTPREIARQLSLSSCSHVVTNSQLCPVIKEAAKILEKPVAIITTDHQAVDGCLKLDELITNATPCQPHTIDVHKDLITMPFSSGTTGTPKGVMLSHFNLVSNMCQFLEGHPQINLMEESSDLHQEVMLCVLPYYHIYEMNAALGPGLRTGAKQVTLPKFDPKTFVSALAKYQPTILHVAPPLALFLANSPDVKPHHLDSVKDVVSAAAPLGQSLVDQFTAKFPQTVIREAWGMSELSPFGLVTPKNKVKVGSCGVPVANAKIKVVDVESNEALGPGKLGELCCTGPMMMKGYINNQEATDHTIRDGWLYTGDIAYYDEDCHVFIVDRIKELIKVKGYQVPPAEIEDLLRTHQGVKDVAVIGIPHERFGEAPRAYVVKQPNSQEDLDEKDVEDFVSKNVAVYKQLAGGVEFIDVIPKSAAGKTLRRVLVDQYKQKVAATK